MIDVLESRLPIKGIMSDREKVFAEGLVKFFKHQGYLSDKQLQGATKLAVRLMVERDPLFP